jgi:hypothetical protein
MECDLRFGRCFSFQSTNIEQLSEIVLRIVMWNQQDKPGGHLIDLCRQYTCSTIWIHISMNSIRHI